MSDTVRTGWLSPTGEFTPCHSYNHIAVAEVIADNLHLPTLFQDHDSVRHVSPDTNLMNIGYAYVGVSSLGMTEWRIGWKQHLSPEQVRFLRPYFDGEYNYPVNEFATTMWNEEINV